MKKLNKNDYSYKIVKIVDGEPITVEMFNAVDHESAIEYLNSFKATHSDGDYRWMYNSPFYCHYSVGDDNNESNDMDVCTLEAIVNLKMNGKNIRTRGFSKTFSKKHYKNIEFAVEPCVDDFESIVENYDIDSRTTHCNAEFWSLDTHIMNDLLFNIEKLKAEGHGYPTQYVEQAKIELGPGALDEDLCARCRFLWNKELDDLAMKIKIYLFYVTFGESFADDVSEVYIPHLPGSYACIDYKKLHELSQSAWYAWIDKFKEIGQGLWD